MQEEWGEKNQIVSFLSSAVEILVKDDGWFLVKNKKKIKKREKTDNYESKHVYNFVTHECT